MSGRGTLVGTTWSFAAMLPTSELGLFSRPDVLPFQRMTHASEDHAIAAGVVARDEGSLRRAFDQFGGAIRSVAFRVVRNDTLADDVVQETFLAFWRDPSKFDPNRGSLKTFLLTIAHRRSVDLVRSEEARTRRELVPPDPESYDLEDEVVARSLSETVRGALSKLSADEKTAISLAYFDGLTYVEVAKHLDTPEGTVKSRIRAGMKKLASTLEGLPL